MKKIIRSLLYAAGLTSMLILSAIAGIRLERNHQEVLEMQREHISEIAVVNMDDGVETGETLVNYASQLMGFPDSNFTVTGLTDAKSGIENGIYAAYIIIPETFSASVTSIDGEPQKVTLHYQYNERLDEESKLRAVGNVNAFITLLNSNIAYMYMDAILAEFHRVQDDSVTILSNDNAELEMLAYVNAAQLIAVAEPVEDMAVVNDINPVDLTAYTGKNSIILESMQTGYADSVRKGREDYAVIRETGSEVKAASDEFKTVYHAVVEDTVQGQAPLLEKGRSSLTEAVGYYNQEIEAKREAVERIVGEAVNEQISLDRTEADRQIGEIVERAGRKRVEELNDLQTAWENVYEIIKEKTEKDVELQLGISEDSTDKPLHDMVEHAYLQGLDDALEIVDSDIKELEEQGDVSGNDIQKIIEDYKKDGTLQQTETCISKVEELRAEVEAWLCRIQIDWTASEALLPSVPEEGEEPDEDIVLEMLSKEQIAVAAEGIPELFKLESESAEIDAVIQTCFVDALQEEGKNQMSRLPDAEKYLTESMESYEGRLEEYDPLIYIERANLNAYLEDINANAGEMLDSVEENNLDYQLYAMDMYTASAEHTAELRSALDEAAAETAANVESCIGELKVSRESVNEQNAAMLKEFTGLLHYTRVGSQGNAEVYDYIVNPVVSETGSRSTADTAAPVQEGETPVKMWLVIVLGIGIVICLTEIFVYLKRQYRRLPGEAEDA